MLHHSRGFALALGLVPKPIVPPAWMHAGVYLPDLMAILALCDRLLREPVSNSSTTAHDI